jgi:hypothetical protein
LPSQGIPYDSDFKLYIRPFRVPEYRLLSRAVELGDVSHLIRAVDNVISVDANNLTIGDFFYVLLWLRINSMPKSPYVVQWMCEQPFFTRKSDGKQLLYTDADWPTIEELRTDYNNAPCHTDNTSIIHNNTTEIVSLEEDTKLPEGFDFPRMAHFIDRAAALKDPDFVLLAPAIQWVAGKTWADKVAAVEADPGLIGEGLDINRSVVHGISETVKFNCNHCRVEHTQKLELNAISFFR